MAALQSAVAGGHPPGRRPIPQVAGAILLALLFGVLGAVIKGHGPGVRDAVGNLSAPWLIVPLLAGSGAAGGRTGRGAVVGLLATVVAIAGFYAANAFVLDRGSPVELELTAGSGVILAERGAITGLLMGAVGVWCRRRHPALVGWVAAILLMLEPIAHILYAASAPVALGGVALTSPVLAGEAAAGAALAIAIWVRGRRQRSA